MPHVSLPCLPAGRDLGAILNRGGPETRISLGKLWGSASAVLPTDPRPGAVALETNQMRLLVAVEVLDGVVQADLRIASRPLRQRVVEPRRPAQLLGRAQHQFLV